MLNQIPMQKTVIETQDLSVKGAKAAREAAVEIVTGSRRSPSFREWRRLNDAVMVPDRGFTVQLKQLDPDLEVVWDWGSSKWNIWRFPSDGKEAHHVLTVETKDKTYRELGADILLKLQAGDTHRFTLTELINYFDELDNQVQRRKARDLSNKLEGISKEIWDFHYRPQVGTLEGWRPIRVQVPREFRVRRIIGNENG